MRNKSEKANTFEVRAYRYVREEVTFEVDATSEADAEEKADVILENDIDELEWEPDYEYCPDVGCSVKVVKPAPPLKQVSKEEFVSRFHQIEENIRRRQLRAQARREP